MSYHIHKNPLPPPGIKPPAPCPKMIEKMRQLEEEEKKAKVAQEIFMHEAMDFKFVTTAIGQAKEEIIAAVEGIDPYVALTSSELDDITSDEDLNTSTNE